MGTSESIELNKLKDFIDWSSKIPFSIKAGVKLYDVKGYYKYLNETELFMYYNNRCNSVLIRPM